MSNLEIFYTVLTALSGMGVFIYGMKLMGDSLEALAGNRIKGMFAHIDKNPLIGVGIGAGTTAVIQSSAAVTVMLIGFVNSNLMTLTQATSVVFGANIGTTITAQILALGYGGIQSVKLTVIFGALAGVGAFMLLFFKKDIVRKIGAVICGLGMIFVGLSVTGDAMENFQNAPVIVNAIQKITNPMLLLLLGAVITALIQSSSAVSGLLITMSVAGIISFPQAMYVIIGSNIGTCITSILCALGTCTNAKRVALVHLLFNVIGSLLFMLTDLFAHYADLLTKWFSTPELQIAMLHTFFNVATTIVLLPFTKGLVKLATLIIPESKKHTDDGEPKLHYINNQILSTPPLAVQSVKLEILRMFDLARDNVELALDSVTTGNADKKDVFARREDEINFLNREITKVLVPLSRLEMRDADSKMLGASYHTVSDIERMGDYAENIIEYAEKLQTAGHGFSKNGLDEISALRLEIDNMFTLTRQIFDSEDPSLIAELYVHEQNTDDLKAVMGQSHVERLGRGECDPETGALYLSLASDCERIADHLTNIANSTATYAKPKHKTREENVNETK